MEKIATHDGNFHADDVFGVAILKLIYPKIKIIRTRDIEKIAKANIRVDVGRKYNPKTNDFDHHQKEFNNKRKNGIPYASAGLVWKHFGKQLVNSEKGFNYIDESIIQPLDAVDNGIQICLKNIIDNYSVGNVINSFRPNWRKKNMNYDKEFAKAVLFVTDLLKREIEFAKSLRKAREIIKTALLNSNKEYLVLDYFVPWEGLIEELSDIKFVICSYINNEWCVEAVPIKSGSFESKKLFPKKWADLNDEELAKVTGVNDAIFCHKHRFCAVAKSKEGAIKLVELALKEK